MKEQAHHPPIIIISGAMGSGKGTIVHALANELDLTWVKTHTTRPMRHDDSVISKRVFDTEVNFLRNLDRGEILIPAKVAGHYYGLSKNDLEHELRLNHPVILEITVDGGIELAKLYPNCVLIFIQTDTETSLKRVEHRNMKESEIDQRLNEAKQEEVLAKKHYDFLVENVEGAPGEAIETIKDLIHQKFPQISTD